MNAISFALAGSPAKLMPTIDGEPLLALVSAYEKQRGYDVPGASGGLAQGSFEYGPPERYWLGDFEPRSYFAELGANYVLACECGEVGCWPLLCRIRVEGETVVWEQFRQPHRPERDYAGFGPFVFDLAEYRRALGSL